MYQLFYDKYGDFQDEYVVVDHTWQLSSNQTVIETSLYNAATKETSGWYEGLERTGDYSVLTIFKILIAYTIYRSYNYAIFSYIGWTECGQNHFERWLFK